MSVNKDDRMALNTLGDIIEQYHFEALQGLKEIVNGLLHNTAGSIDVAVFGQFNTGKSSFLNSILGKPLLPAGVLPLTSVITYISAGESEKAAITHKDQTNFEIGVDDLEQYISEKLNPKNIKKVRQVNIETPQLQSYPNLKFIDTPGIGSVYQHNSETSQNWLPTASVAIYVVSAERPLSDNDVKIIEDIQLYCSRVVVLVTKTDLFENSQVREIKDFIDAALQKQFHKPFDIFEYSTVKDSQTYKEQIMRGLLNPLNTNVSAELSKSLVHKLNTLRQQCLTYLRITYKASLKTQAERQMLLDYITREAGNIQFIYTELLLVSQRYIDQTRDIVYLELERFRERLTQTTINEFRHGYDAWQGNLHNVSRQYEAFLKTSLQAQLQQILQENPDISYKNIRTASEHLLNFTKTFRNKLFNQLYEALGMSPGDAPILIMPDYVMTPDISISRAFESHLDMFWFLFPMRMYRGYFKRYFTKQIPAEVAKNLHRVTSDLTGKINKQINTVRDEVLRQLSNEILTLKSSLTFNQNKSAEIQRDLLLLENSQAT